MKLSVDVGGRVHETIETSDDAHEQMPEALAGGGQHIPTPAVDVVEVEEAVGEVKPQPSEQTSVTAWLFRPGGDASLAELRDIRTLVADDENLIWIDLCNYAEPDLRQLAADLGLSRAEVLAALSSWRRPGLHAYGNRFLVSVTVARMDEHALRIQASQLNLFVGRNYLVSAHKLPLPFAGRLLTRAHNNPDLVRLDSAYMLYILLDELLQYYEELYEQVQTELEDMEEQALSDQSDELLPNLLQFKRYIFALVQLATHHRQVFAAFLRPDFHLQPGDEVEVYFRDLEGRLGHLIDLLEAAREGVNNTFNIYVSQVAHHTNQIMKVLTMVSTVLLPVTVILAVFGTSFKGVPIYGPRDFLLMLLLSALVATTSLVYFKRKGWL